MQLIPEWKRAWRLWSVRLSALIVALSLLEPSLPQLREALPDNWYSYLAATVIVARVLVQQKLVTAADPARGDSDPPPVGNQSGFALGSLLAAVAALGLLLGGVYFAGRAAAQQSCQIDRQQRERQLSDERDQAKDVARATERTMAAALAAADANYQESLTREKETRDRRIADLLADRRRLSIPVRPGSCRVSDPAASPGLGDGEARAELSPEAAAFLEGLALDADSIVRQLGAAQSVIRIDRGDLVEMPPEQNPE